MITGALAPDNGGLTVEEGYDAARHCGLNIIATLKKQLGDLDRVEQVVKVCIYPFYVYEFDTVDCNVPQTVPWSIH